MRYFFIFLLLSVVAVVSFAGFRGTLSRRPPLEVFPDMKRQPKLRPQKPSALFEDRRDSRLSVLGTIPLGTLLEDNPVATGRVPGTTNFVETNPLPVTAELLALGRERYTIYCAPCHNPVGDGNGIITKYGLLKAGNYHEPRLVRAPDGELFNTITAGKNQMASYASQVSITNRWAIIAYIRALERARLGRLEDVPADTRASLK
jgi:mono/diheme cytochrome c family protein